MKTVWSSTFAALAIAAMSFGSIARGDVIYFSQVGEPTKINPSDQFSLTRAPAALDPNATPSVTLDADQETTLHLWLQSDATVHNYDSVAWSIESSNPGVLDITNHTVANFQNIGLARLRWESALPGELGADGSATLLTNSRGFKVQGPGIGTGQPGPFNTAPFDYGRDDITNSFYLGSVTLKATGSGTAGLYLRTGEFKTVLNTGLGASFRYGASGGIQDGANVGGGDAIDAGLTLADAIITVQGGPTRTDVFQIGGDPTGGINIPYTGVKPVAVDIDAAAGKIVVDPGFARNEFYEVFFDVDFAAGANTDLAGVIDLLEEQGLDVRPGAALPTGPNRELENYDFSVRIPGPVVAPAGAQGAVGPLVLDFDFSANGMTGVTVNQVAVPEPSSIAIAALGLVAVFGFRRRKA